MLLLGQHDVYDKYKAYAGIGSRTTPVEILEIMERIGLGLGLSGYTLRSGGAVGADMAFEAGATRSSYDKEIFISHQNKPAEGRIQLEGVYLRKAMEIASRHHPAWDKCNDHARGLHARNVAIILGEKLDSKVKSVICWTPEDEDGNVQGGTGLGIRIARSHGIRVDNLWRPKILKIWIKDLASAVEEE